MTDIQVVALEGVDTIWVRFKSVGVRVELTRDQALEFGQQLIETAAPVWEPA